MLSRCKSKFGILNIRNIGMRLETFYNNQINLKKGVAERKARPQNIWNQKQIIAGNPNSVFYIILELLVKFFTVRLDCLKALWTLNKLW